MTDTAIPVTQADRDAAADAVRQHLVCSLNTNLGDTMKAALGFKSGQLDDFWLVQAFAKHRLASTPDAADRPDTAGLVEEGQYLANYGSANTRERDYYRQSATHITTLEAKIARLQAAMREARRAVEWIAHNGTEYGRKVNGELLTRIDALLSDAPEDRGKSLDSIEDELGVVPWPEDRGEGERS